MCVWAISHSMSAQKSNYPIFNDQRAEKYNSWTANVHRRMSCEVTARWTKGFRRVTAQGDWQNVDDLPYTKILAGYLVRCSVVLPNRLSNRHQEGARYWLILQHGRGSGVEVPTRYRFLSDLRGLAGPRALPGVQRMLPVLWVWCERTYLPPSLKALWKRRHRYWCPFDAFTKRRWVCGWFLNLYSFLYSHVQHKATATIPLQWNLKGLWTSSGFFASHLRNLPEWQGLYTRAIAICNV